MEPFSTSVFKVLIWIFATTTKICTKGCSTQAHAQGFVTTPAPTYSPMSRIYIGGEVSVRRLSASIFRASWFGRWVVTHSLAGSDFHGHRPAVYINQHLLWCLMSVDFGTLSSAFGSSRIASSAYQKWPTWNSDIQIVRLQLSKSDFLPI